MLLTKSPSEHLQNNYAYWITLDNLLSSSYISRKQPLSRIQAVEMPVIISTEDIACSKKTTNSKIISINVKPTTYYASTTLIASFTATFQPTKYVSTSLASSVAAYSIQSFIPSRSSSQQDLHRTPICMARSQQRDRKLGKNMFNLSTRKNPKAQSKCTKTHPNSG